MLVVRDARWAAALLALVGLLTPGVSGVVVAVHLSAHHAAAAHHEGGHDRAADLSVLWHGHSHEKTTPAHDHPLLVAEAEALRIATMMHPVRASGHWQHAAFAVAAEQCVSCLSPPGLAGVGPPPHAKRLSILRI